MKTLHPALLFLLLLASCAHQPDRKKFRQDFRQSKYENEVINGLPLYDSLKNILVGNIDSIFKYRNSMHFVFHSYANGDTATVREDANFYWFYRYNGEGDPKLLDDVSLGNMPAFLYPAVDDIFKKLGKDRIRGFRLSRDSTIEISVKAFRKDNIEVGHTVTWKRSTPINHDPENFFRDTLIAPNWIYEIWVDEREGQ